MWNLGKLNLGRVTGDRFVLLKWNVKQRNVGNVPTDFIYNSNKEKKQKAKGIRKMIIIMFRNNKVRSEKCIILITKW